MLYWEMRLEINATWEAQEDNPYGFVEDRADLEFRDTSYAQAFKRLQSALEAYGFNPKKDVVTVAVRIYTPEDDSHNYEILQRWSTRPFGKIRPLILPPPWTASACG